MDFSRSDSSPGRSSLQCWIFSQASLTFVRPRVADEPFKKWPSWERSSKSFAALYDERISQRWTLKTWTKWLYRHVSWSWMWPAHVPIIALGLCRQIIGSSPMNGHSQCFFHLFECTLCLLKEPKHNSLAEIPLLLIVVHLEDLLKCGVVDLILVICEVGRTFLFLRHKLAYISKRRRWQHTHGGLLGGVTGRHFGRS